MIVTVDMGGGNRKNKNSLTTSVCRQSMLQTLTLFPQFARDGKPLTSTIYSLTDKVTAHAAALLLAPHRREAYMARNWKREWIPRAIENVRTLWRKRYKDKVPIDNCTPVQSPQRNQMNLIYGRDQSTISQIGDEFDSFIDGNPVLNFFSVKGRHH